MHITLRQIEIFCAIYESGSVLAASQQLNLVQSAASNALKQLEQQLNQVLFDRVAKKIVANNAGKAFYAKAKALLDQAQAVAHYFDDYIAPLKIAASSTIGNYLLPTIIAKHCQQYENQKIQLSVGNTQDIIEKIANFDCDLGFIEGSCAHPDLDCHFWKQDTIVWFANKNSRWIDYDTLDQKSLKKLPIIAREIGSGTREYMQSMIDQENIQYELGSSEAIKKAVAEDLGISCLSKEVIAGCDEFITLKINDMPELKRALYWLTHREKKKMQSTQNFLYQALQIG